MSEQAAQATLFTALLAAQSEFPEIPKDRENTFFKSKYSTLDAIISATRPVLNKHGIIVDNYLSLIEGRWHVVGRLTLAASREERTNPYPLAVNFDTLSPQARGSEITYGRRYSLAPMLGITSDEDDDGNAASAGGEKERSREKREPQRREPPPKQEQQAADPPKKTTEDFIAECKSAADLATLLTSLVGKYPVKDHADRWKHLGLAAKNRMEASDWADPHKAIVAAVLDGVRNQLKAPAASAKGDPAKAPALERICGWIDQQETPDDLLRVMIDIRDGARFIDLRADPQRVSDICVHALRFVKSKVDLKDWTDESVDAVCNEIDAIDAHYQLELQANATFGGGNESAS